MKNTCSSPKTILKTLKQKFFDLQDELYVWGAAYIFKIYSLTLNLRYKKLSPVIVHNKHINFYEL